MNECLSRIRGAAFVTAGLLISGCSGKRVDLDPPREPSFAGTWTSSVSSSAFVSSPKTLHLELDESGHGTLLVGDEPLPPPTDPTLGSPPEAESDAGAATGLLLHLYEGMEYSVLPTNVFSRGLFFELDAFEAFAPLCAIEAPISTDLGYRCLPNWGGGVDRTGGGKRCYQTDPDSGDRSYVDCLVLYLCTLDPTRGCRCTESSCSATDGGSPGSAAFQLQLSTDGSSLNGNVNFSQSPYATSSAVSVFFTREAN